jgi:two-component system, OmpR family, response regulator
MQILIVEDDPALAAFLREGLGGSFDGVTLVEDGRAALDAALAGTFDAIVLDRMLPMLNGMDVMRELRVARIRTPVIMLTALGSLDDRIEGLEAGADDYLVKPFAIGELIARLNALVRRRHTDAAAEVLRAGDIELDLVGHKVRRGKRIIPLQRREFGLLAELVRNADRAVTRTMLLERVWNYNFDPRTNIVETHISRLRAKLNEGGETDPIVTVRGGGYMIRDAS